MRGGARLRRGLGLAPVAQEPTTPNPSASRRGPSWDNRGNPLPEGELPTIAAITMARDEGDMIGHWARHYAGEFGAENVYVIDDHSSDGSTDDLPATVLRFPYLRKHGFEPSRMGILSNFANSLLFAYDGVLTSDADEFVVADPKRWESIRHLAAAHPDRQAIAFAAYNVIHDLSREGPLRFDQPLLRQRAFAKFTPLMCKPGLKFVRADWSHASHAIGCRFEIDPDLVMFHMKFADRDLLAAAAQRRNDLNRAENRAKQTSWAKTGDEMVAVLDDVAQQVAGDPHLRDFRPGRKRLAGIIRQEGEPGSPGERWRTTGDGQIYALRKGKFSAIPPRFREML